MSLADLHAAWAWVVVIANGLAGLWALAAWRVDVLRIRWLWWFTAAAQVTVFVQAGLGVGLVAGQGREAPQFHTFYGFVAIIAIGIIYSYRQQMRHQQHLLYGLGELFVMGLAIRALYFLPF